MQRIIEGKEDATVEKLFEINEQRHFLLNLILVLLLSQNVAVSSRHSGQTRRSGSMK